MSFFFVLEINYRNRTIFVLQSVEAALKKDQEKKVIWKQFEKVEKQFKISQNDLIGKLFIVSFHHISYYIIHIIQLYIVSFYHFCNILNNFFFW